MPFKLIATHQKLEWSDL